MTVPRAVCQEEKYPRSKASKADRPEAVGLTNGILIGFSMVVPAALIALFVLLRGGGEAPMTAVTDF
jgi:hypothetical protein